jgi:N-acetylmuramoyl-L-alanine amidase
MIFIFKHIPTASPCRVRKFPANLLPFIALLAGMAVWPVAAAAQGQSRPPQAQPTPPQGQATPAAKGKNPITPPAPKAVSGPRFVVVLDAAHGGDDSGAQLGASEAEKTLTLNLSVRLRSLLAARGIGAVTTREGNVNLDSDARAQIANHAGVAWGGAAACVILHASEAGSGVHIYVSSLGPLPMTRFLAWKTAQAAYVNRSLRLAGTVNSALQHTSITGGGTAAGSGVGSGVGSDSGAIPAVLGRASMPGLDSMTCPAVAIEMAPVRGADRKVVTEVTDPEYQTQLVEALAAALLEWKVDVETSPRPGLEKLP